jgi:MFS family permease
MQSTKPVRVPVAMAGIMLSYFIFFASMSMPAIALPRTAADLDGMALFSWAVTAPGLAAAVVTLIFGKLSDLYGRRSILVVALTLVALGSALCAVSQDMLQFVGARMIQGLGVGSLIALCFSVLGDLFPVAERGKWAGLLNLAMGAAALTGPILGGMITDTLGWRYVFWFFVPVALLTATIVWAGVPSIAHSANRRIDYPGLLLMILASTATLLALSWAGSVYPWGSVQIAGMLGLALLMWAAFLWVESRVAEPVLSPAVLRNRIFLTVSVGGMLSGLGLQAVVVYLPLFLQGVQGLSATVTGQLMTPYNVMTALMGLAGGLLLARFRRYRWMMIGSYGALTIALFWLSQLNHDTSILVVVLASSLCGIGLGALPTINPIVIQNATPPPMIGQAMGGNLFFVLIGMAMAPAILGSAMNSAYTQALPAHLPAAAVQTLDAQTLASLDDPRVLLSPPAMDALRDAFSAAGPEAQSLFQETMLAARTSLEGALAGLFLLGAIVMIGSLLLVATIPEIPLGEPKTAPTAEAGAAASRKRAARAT